MPSWLLVSGRLTRGGGGIIWGGCRRDARLLSGNGGTVMVYGASSTSSGGCRGGGGCMLTPSRGGAGGKGNGIVRRRRLVGDGILGHWLSDGGRRKRLRGLWSCRTVRVLLNRLPLRLRGGLVCECVLVGLGGSLSLMLRGAGAVGRHWWVSTSARWLVLLLAGRGGRSMRRAVRGYAIDRAGARPALYRRGLARALGSRSGSWRLRSWRGRVRLSARDRFPPRRTMLRCG